MQIKMIHVAAGPDGVLLPEQEYSVADDMGAALVAGGHAVEVMADADDAGKVKGVSRARRQLRG